VRRRVALALLSSIFVVPLSACVSSPSQFVKTDIDRIAEMHRREIDAGLLRLGEKLYRRNPREWRKGGYSTLEAALSALGDPTRGAMSPEPVPPGGTEGRRGGPVLLAALRDDYPYDRVGAFVGGLQNMVNDAFDGKTEFYALDDLDAQKLYNAARNVEIAAWKLANAHRLQPDGDIPAGAPLLFSNEMTPLQNLSFEREFGRLIGNLDMLSRIAADKNQRTVVKVVQNLATAIFLPIK
jgi:hypothetical protein